MKMTVFSGFLFFLFLWYMSAELAVAVPDLSAAVTKGGCLFYKSKKLTTHGGGGGWADPPPPLDTTGYSQQAGGTHPTGVHSCLILVQFPTDRKSINYHLKP